MRQVGDADERIGQEELHIRGYPPYDSSYGITFAGTHLLARVSLEPSTTTRLLLVRHGQTHTSRDDAFCGVTEVPLTSIGRSQAQCLSERLRREHVDALYCSPQQRALETATVIGLALEVEIQTRNELREMDFGVWENRLRADLAREYPHELEEWERGSWMAYPPGGETQQAVVARVVPCIVDILSLHAGQSVVIVSHKSVLRLLIGHLLNMTPPDSRHLRLDPASLSELRVTGDHVELVRCNDTSHLSL
jgi:broad specificity phosphatase PhoE